MQAIKWNADASLVAKLYVFAILVPLLSQKLLNQIVYLNYPKNYSKAAGRQKNAIMVFCLWLIDPDILVSYFIIL